MRQKIMTKLLLSIIFILIIGCSGGLKNPFSGMASQEAFEENMVISSSSALPGYTLLKSSSSLNYVRADCPSGTVIVGGGCQGSGTDGLIAEYPDGFSWICEYTTTLSGKISAFASCALPPTDYEIKSIVGNNAVTSDCGEKTLIGGGCFGGKIIASHASGNKWLCQFQDSEIYSDHAAYAICAGSLRTRGASNLVFGTKDVSVTCPSGSNLISGGCSSSGNSSIISSYPTENAWTCQFSPVETTFDSAAQAICSG
jgi:hypothetical protein